jgi:hypothetical protein
MFLVCFGSMLDIVIVDTKFMGRLAPHAGRPAPRGPTYQPPCYVGSPPPPRMHLHR